ncbi:hypothetical protein [Orenia marismortui]|uniref:Uncharacterized protein n=1 Tax=Orenia marismortui TaxID=46469 RepID=A0A4R8H0W2_9FIRM|nr:hypothetical protein [Orenia marismortui]TDX53027.1 hypothetical protein C7959_104157 [Orenia marismortui]
MNLASNNSKLTAIFENRLLMLSLTIILFLSSCSFLTYRILNSLDNQKEISRFENKIAHIAEMGKKAKDNIDKDNITKPKDNSKTLAINNYSNKNPFKVKLQYKPRSSSDRSNNDEDIKELPQQELSKQIKVLGILNNSNNIMAIIKFGNKNSAVKIMKNGEAFLGFTIKKINNDSVIMENDGRYFTYIFGGEDN